MIHRSAGIRSAGAVFRGGVRRNKLVWTPVFAELEKGVCTCVWVGGRKTLLVSALVYNHSRQTRQLGRRREPPEPALMVVTLLTLLYTFTHRAGSQRLAAVAGPLADDPSTTPNFEKALLGQVILDSSGCAQLSHSVFMEELTLLPEVLNGVPTGHHGTFVEIGGADGDKSSNTLVLERCFGFQGLLIEPNPSNFLKLMHANRTSVIMNAAASPDCDATNSINVTIGGDMEAGVASERETDPRRKMYKDAGEVAVPCARLGHMVKLAAIGYERPAGAPRIDLLIVDVEGAEEYVMKSAGDLSMYRIIMVEALGVKKGLDSDIVKDARVHALIMGTGIFRESSDLWVPWSRVYVRVDAHA